MIGCFRLVSLVGSLSLVHGALSPEDPVTFGQTFLAGSLDPTDGSTPWALTSHGIAEKLFTVNAEGEIVGQVAESVVKVSDFVWDVTLKAGKMFSDGSIVSAQDVTDCLMEQNQLNSNAQSSLGAMMVTAPSDLQVRIQSELETHVMDAVLAEWAFVVYKVSNDGIVFSGPFVVESFSESQIDLIPNAFYPQADQRPNVQIKKFANGHELAESAKNLDIDIGFHLPIDTLPDIRRTEGVDVKSFEVGYHYMMFYNTDTLDDVNVRKAIDVVIDRTALSQALAGGHATRSLFPDNSPYYHDDSDPHGDSNLAASLLEQAGWTLNSDGKREKDGQVLTVTLVAYPHRPGLVIMQPVIAESLETLGITVNQIVTGQDWPETQQVIDDRSFDLLLWAQHTLPAGDPLWFLRSFFHSDGGNNHAGISSVDIDSHIGALGLAEEHGERVLLSQATQEAIFLEVPVSNLVTPYWHISLTERVQDYEPYGSDYYIVRDDLSVTQLQTTSSAGGMKVAVSFGSAVLGCLIVSGLYLW